MSGHSGHGARCEASDVEAYLDLVEDNGLLFSPREEMARTEKRGTSRGRGRACDYEVRRCEWRRGECYTLPCHSLADPEGMASGSRRRLGN